MQHDMCDVFVCVILAVICKSFPPGMCLYVN